jgi:hypothetical protein
MPLLGNTWDTVSFTGDISASTFIGGISSTLQAITENGTTTDQAISLTNTTDSTSTTTGAVKITGGLGVAGNVHASFLYGDGSNLTGISSSTLQAITENGTTTDQAISLTNTTDSTSTTTGALKLSGGLGVAGNVHASFLHGDGSNLTGISSTLQEITSGSGNVTNNGISITNESATTGVLTGALQVTNGGLYVSGNVLTSENLTVTGNLVVNGNTTTVNSTSLTVSDTIIHIGNDNNSGVKDTGLIFGKPNSNVALFYDTSESKLQIGLTDSHASSDTISLSATEIPVSINGSVTATSFSGSGSGLTNISSTLQEITENGTTTDQIITFTNTTDSTSTTTGAVKITGGLGVAKKIYAGDDITAFSDKRHKSNIERIENALDKVCQLSGYTFDYNGERKTGVLAQEIKEVLPEAVYGSEDTTYSVAYGNLAGIIIEAIKELKNEIQELKNN